LQRLRGRKTRRHRREIENGEADFCGRHGRFKRFRGAVVAIRQRKAPTKFREGF
jgi:hypothetical protein